MNPDDAFERILSPLYEAALDDARWPAATALMEEAVGAVGNAVGVSEGCGADERLFFARLLYRGEFRDDLAREYYELYYPHDEGPRRHEDAAQRPVDPYSPALHRNGVEDLGRIQ